MPGARSIGSLFVDIEARTAKLEGDLGKVKTILQAQQGDVALLAGGWTKAGNQIEGTLERIGIRLIAGRSLTYAAANEIRRVIMDIENIPGVPASTVASVEEMTMGVGRLRNALDRVIAWGAGVFADFGKAIGVTLGEIVYGEEAVNDSLKAQVTDVNALARARDPKFDEKLQVSLQREKEERHRVSLAMLDNANKIIYLRQVAALYYQDAEHGNLNLLQQSEQRLKGDKETEDANRLMTTLREQEQRADERLTEAMVKGKIKLLPLHDQIVTLSKEELDIRMKLHLLEMTPGTTPAELAKDPRYIQAKINLENELTRVIGQKTDAERRYGETAVKAATIVGEDFENAIFQAKSLDEAVQALIKDLLQLFFRRSITEPLVSYLSGAFGTILGTKHASGGPMGPGESSWVGEFGPEVITTGSPATVIPNNQLGGSSGGPTFFIDARGADAQRLELLERRLIALNASVERRAVAAVVQGKRRGGSLALALG